MNKKRIFLVVLFSLCVFMCFNKTFASIYEDRITNSKLRREYKQKVNAMQKTLKNGEVTISVNKTIEGISITYDESSSGSFGDWIDERLKNVYFTDEGKINAYFNGIVGIVNRYAEDYKYMLSTGLYNTIKSDGQYITKYIAMEGDKTTDVKVTATTDELLKNLTNDIAQNVTDAAISRVTGIELDSNNKLKTSLYDWTISQINKGKPFSTALSSLIGSVKNAYSEASNKNNFANSSIINGKIRFCKMG